MLCLDLLDTYISAATALGYVLPVFEDRLRSESFRSPVLDKGNLGSFF